MPIFEYRCAQCGEKTEHLARSAATAVAPVCPVCAVPMEKEWSAVACHSKGSTGAGCSAPGGRFS